MTCTSRFFQSKTLLRELFPALHRGDDDGDGPSQNPSANVASVSEQFAPESEPVGPRSELDDSAEIVQEIVEDPKSKPRKAVPLP